LQPSIQQPEKYVMRATPSVCGKTCLPEGQLQSPGDLLLLEDVAFVRH